MASLLDFLMPNGQQGGLLGNLQPPRQQEPQAQQGGGFGSWLNNNPLMLMALGGGIAQGGIGRGLQAAVPAAQYEQQQQKQQQAQGVTYNALRSAGVPHGQALAGALNPEILKTIARSHFDAKPTFETIGRDEHGQPAYGFIDASRMSVTPYQAPVSGPLASDPGKENAFKDQAASKDISSLNNVIGHFGNLIEASSKLANNGDAPQGSKKINDTKGSDKSPSDRSAARSFALARNAVADEMTKLLRSSGMSENEIRSWKDTLNTSSSPSELRAIIGRSIELMSSRLTVLKDQHERRIGRATPEWLAPKSRAALEKMRQWATEESAE
jgi:hypothetical protein